MVEEKYMFIFWASTFTHTIWGHSVAETFSSKSKAEDALITYCNEVKQEELKRQRLKVKTKPTTYRYCEDILRSN